MAALCNRAGHYIFAYGFFWHAGRTRPWPHCVRWGPSSPSPNFRPISVQSNCDGVIGTVKWHDNQSVTVATNYASVDTVGKVK